MSCSYDDFFQKATGHRPFDYQRKLACDPSLPELLKIPTGAGKTAAVVVAWLWRRKAQPDVNARSLTPRRLVFCLPMRVLVEQTFRAVTEYVKNLGFDGPDGGVSVSMLMGGAVDDEWLVHPEQDHILVGTQDMLLSQVLNRGYGMSRFLWPMSFGFLNSDTLWVFDEIQLMGNGLYTSAQLDRFREVFGAFGSAPSIWMSATADAGWLETVDRRALGGDKTLMLGRNDRENEELARRLNARKSVRFSQIRLNTRGAKREKQKKQESEYFRWVAGFISERHVPGTLTLAVFNTVDRASGVYKELLPLLKPGADLILIHSRFRGVERKNLEERITAPVKVDGPGRILIATQVVEAGLDISARTLFTELAPWPSIVQRLGRLNRFGEHEESDAYWADLSKNASLPYDVYDLDLAREILRDLEGKSAAPVSLPEVPMKYEPTYTLRRRDFEELFDTTPDISGYYTDVSRFVRGSEDPDAQVFWRTWEGDRPGEDVVLPDREELCPVPVWDLRDYRKKKSVWVWDHIQSSWSEARPEQIRAGQLYLLAARDGGYSPAIGWDPTNREPVKVVGSRSQVRPEGIPDNRASYGAARWVELAEHTDHVVHRIGSILQSLDGMIPQEFADRLLLAARYHDAGKAHPAFQERLREGFPETDPNTTASVIWAKSPRRNWPVKQSEKNRDGAEKGPRFAVEVDNRSRRYFRHELASALAVLSAIGDPLVAYLTAAHHGKVRGAIRSVPGENLSNEKRFALGVCEGDRLPGADLGGGVILQPSTLELEVMEMGSTSSGRPSWVETVDRLLKSIGPTRLAFLEALLRAADWQASEGEEKEEATP